MPHLATLVRAALAGLLLCGGRSLAGASRFVDVSRVDSRYFANPDGSTWIPVGCNICFDRLQKPSAEARALFDGWMTAFAANGGDFMRVWLSCPFVEVMPDTAGTFSAEATDNLKWLVARAEQLHIRLKFTFENFRRVAPVQKDLDPAKGIISFTRPAYAPYARDMRAFWDSEDCFRFYVARARHVAEAVGNSPALVAVELWNEYTSTGVSLETGSRWTARMMPEIQRLFPRQMVVQNLGSFSGPTAYADYDWLASVAGNAFLQAHRYLDPGAEMDVCRGPMDVLCADAVRELLDRRPDQPALLAETGAVEPNHTGPSRFYALDKAGELLHDEIFAPFFAGSAGCGQPWHWDHQYIAGNDLWHHFAKFRKAVEGLDPAAEHFRPFHTETPELRLYGLRGEKTTVVWLRDKRATREHDLVQGLPPPVVKGRLPHALQADRYHWYLPWEDRSVDLPTSEMPPFTRAAVVRFATPVRPVAAPAPVARIPHASKTPEGRFHPTYPSACDPATAKARPVPDFLRGAVMYQLFTRMFTPEGTFEAARRKLPELKADGVSVIYLTPHQLADADPDPKHWSARQRASGLGNPKNPYRQKDFFAVDPEYGTADDLRRFVSDAHALGMKVMFDLVYFHCGPRAVFLEDHPDFIVRNPDGTPKLGEWAFPEMDLSKAAVREYLYANMLGFIRDYDVDGFRCDVADMLPVDFWEEAAWRCRRAKPDVFFMCEGLRGDDQLRAFDLSYGFYTQWTMVDLLAGKAPASLLEAAWRAQVRDYPRGFHWMRCFENHDFANLNPGQKRKEALYGPELNAAMLATCFLLDGVPMLYNGQEIADASPHSIWANRDHGGWCIDWSRAGDAVAVERRALVRRLAQLRRDHPALFDAPVVWHSVADPQCCYAFSRPLPDGTTLTLAVNVSRESKSVTLPGGRTVALKPHGFAIQ